MKTPPLLLGATLLFWGWRSDLVVGAVALSVCIECSRVIRVRYGFPVVFFNRVSDLTAVIVFALGLYLMSEHGFQKVPFLLMLLLPFAFAPLLLVQLYSTHEKLPLSALFYSFRHSPALLERGRAYTVDLSYPYFMLVILSASLNNQPSMFFYLGMVLLIAWALFPLRARRYHLVSWLLVMCLAVGLGYLAQVGLRLLHQYLDMKIVEWMIAENHQTGSYNRNSCFLGRLGELNLSDTLLFRVRNVETADGTMLLRTAVYNEFWYLDQSGRSIWSIKPSSADPLSPVLDGQTWDLCDYHGHARQITVLELLKQDETLLKLPRGSFRIGSLQAGRVKRTFYNVVEVEQAPALLAYTVYFNEAAQTMPMPQEMDMIVPEVDHEVMTRVGRELRLSELAPQKAIQTVMAYFRRDFDYSLNKPLAGLDQTEIGHFLDTARMGHCELFATAATLLLRSYGIPTRYVTGFLVHEYSQLEGCHIVREHDAHAWCSAYYQGEWHDFDPTPPSWLDFNSSHTHIVRTIKDFWSWLVFRFVTWRIHHNLRGLDTLWWFLGGILILVLIGRLYTRFRLPLLPRHIKEKNVQRIRPGSDSPLFKILNYLEHRGYRRSPHESLPVFINRLQDSTAANSSLPDCRQIINLHYCYRFDPVAKTRKTREQLDRAVKEWFESIDKSM
ncbi:transglutaminase domain-containing protein [bacterium]|nr:transglutaminase domain-containing protein [bacterium]